MNNKNGIFEVQIEMDNRCKLACLHCSSFGSDDLNENRISLQQLEKFLSVLPSNIIIELTGGEPLLYPELESIVYSIKRIKPQSKIGIFSSGICKDEDGFKVLSTESVNRLKSKGLDFIYFSIYHIRPPEHDFIVNLSGAFQETLRAIQNFLSANIDVRVHLVITKTNIDNLEVIISFLSKIGISEIRILRLVKTGRALKFWNTIGVSYDKQDIAIKQLIANENKFSTKITFSGYPEIVPCRPFDGAEYCQAGCRLLYVTNMGDVFPCACTRNIKEERIGNINDLNTLHERISKINFYYRKKCINPIK